MTDTVPSRWVSTARYALPTVLRREPTMVTGVSDEHTAERCQEDAGGGSSQLEQWWRIYVAR